MIGKPSPQVGDLVAVTAPKLSEHVVSRSRLAPYRGMRGIVIGLGKRGPLPVCQVFLETEETQTFELINVTVLEKGGAQ